MKRALHAFIVFAALVAIWEALVRAKIWSPVLVPSPVEVGKYLVNSVRDGTLLIGSLVTMKRLVLGYAAGLALGLPLGLLIARFSFFQDTLGLLALGVQTLPSVCWA